MKSPLRPVITGFSAVLILFASGAKAQNFTTFQPADLVLLQPDFTTGTGGGGSGPRKASQPSGIAIDPTTGKLFVSDNQNNRILRFRDVASLRNNAGAEAVFGQSNFTDISFGTTRTTLDEPRGIFVDILGRLWVADSGNSRVLMWESASARSTGASADKVVGQTDFTTGLGGVGQRSLNTPFGVFIDADDRLWVADSSNNRVLRFNTPSAPGNGPFANGVLGQTNFSDSASANGPSGLSFPANIVVDAAGRLYVADVVNNRILRFDDAAIRPNGFNAADAVLGQPNFFVVTGGTTASTFQQPLGLALAPDGALWVGDLLNSRALRFGNPAALPNGSPADAILGQPDFTSNPFVTSNRGALSANALTFDAAGRLYVADGGNNRVVRFTAPPAPTQAVDTTAPTLKVKGRRSVDSLRKRVVFRGTAVDAGGIVRVEFKVSGQKGVQKAKGTRGWKAIVRPDTDRRKTVVKVRAIDSAGNRSRFLKLKILRR